MCFKVSEVSVGANSANKGHIARRYNILPGKSRGAKRKPGPLLTTSPDNCFLYQKDRPGNGIPGNPGKAHLPLSPQYPLW